MRWMLLILVLFLSGCYAHYQGRYQGYQGPPPLQATSMAQVDAMVGVQQPAAYKVGFMEGCDSGRLSAGDNSFLFKKDTNRFNTDDVYKQGWSDGFNRCVSGAGVTAYNNYYPSYSGYDYYYPYYNPGTFYSGFYYPSYYYAPGYSVWLGYYGYPRHRHYVYNRNYYYTPWYGGHRHRGGKYYSSRRGNYGYGRGPYINPGGKGKSHRGWGGKSRGGRSGGRSGGSWIR